IGEMTNLRARHPLTAMGFAFVVRSNVFAEEGAFYFLRNQLARLRKPDGVFDSTMLLVAEWGDDRVLQVVDDPALAQASVDDPEPVLCAPRFFRDLIDAVMRYTPGDVYTEVRLRRQGEPIGGMPPEDEDANAAGGGDSPRSRRGPNGSVGRTT